MAFWEFLIQQEGDRSWLPLESPDVEVLEGRYRVVARSSRMNTPVEISIIQTITTEHPPRRRVQKRMGQTNPDGLLVVLPFTRLEPGAWELRCVGDLMSDLMGEGWGYGVKLQVLSHETDADGDDDLLPEDWHSHVAVTDQAVEQATADKTADRAAEPSESENLPECQSLQNSLQNSEEMGDRPPASSPIEPAEPVAVADDFLAALEAIETEPAEPSDLGAALAEVETENGEAREAIAAGAETGAAVSGDSVKQPPEQPTKQPPEQPDLSPTQASAIPSPADLPPLRLVLHPDHYTAQWGGPLRISGQVVAANPDSAPDSALELPALYLDLALRDPQSGEPLAQIRHKLPGGALPRAVDCGIDIPDVDATRLMLGEATLSAPQGEQQEPFLLAAQSFTVTAALDDLLEAIANDFPGDLTSPFVDEEDLDLSLLNLVDGTPASAAPLPEVRPAGDQVLPPQIFQPAAAADAPTAKPVELPPWGNPLPGFENGMSLWQLAAAVLTGQTPVTRLDSSAPPPDPSQTDETQSTADQTEGELTHRLLPDDQAARVEEVANFADSDAATLESPPPPLAAAEDADLSIYLTHVNRASRSKLPVETPPDEPRAAVREASPAEADPLEAGSSETANLEAAVSEPPPDQTQPTPAIADSADTPLEWNHEAFSLGQPAPLPNGTPRFLSPEDRAFQALNLQRRFLARLTALATDRELGTLMQPGSPPLGRDLDLTTDEIVVEDAPLPPPQRSSLYRPEHAPEPPPVVLPAEEPVPSPVMDVPQGELTSGQRIEIGIALPDLEPRFYIKLWLRDRQSRTILDGPRWVMNFAPDGQGYQIAYTQVTVPFGCVETQFEAIAVEMSTQRESRKVVQSRRVVPPDLPQLDLNDLGI
ncbi:hypothetical protein [Thermoleptolyngbya sp. M55_K2018_002]|uniref:hypothetical protein n=1 Tax=Thermoleptolyngbya sp. M55_K2018_002 TaxID=2747808 RepID=UPI0019FCD3A1|nr:hypothetical protein [Thermoleptolyngbya sp. M55_K2018_002]HIK42045.1 hypothetical protein [Thermoleptolyngbya sp. M55_K2018_002]